MIGIKPDQQLYLAGGTNQLVREKQNYSVLLLYNRFGDDNYVGEDVKLLNKMRKLLPRQSVEMVIIDTKLDIGNIEYGNLNLKIYGAPNNHREFSCWDYFLKKHPNIYSKFDFICFCTSAYNNGYSDHLDYISTEMLDYAMSNYAFMGHMEFYNEPAVLNDVKFQSWIGSSFVLCPSNLLYRLKKVSSINPNKYFSKNPKSPFLKNAPVNDQYKKYLTDWLTGAGTGQGVTWYNTFDLTEESLPTFVSKATAIMNEMKLSIELRRLGGTLVDMTWLNKKLKESQQFLAAPHCWHSQVIERSLGHDDAKKKANI